MRKRKYGEFMDFIDSQLEDCTQELRKEILEYLANTKRLRELSEKLDELPLEEKDMSILKDYLTISLEMAAEEQPAFYAKGFADVMRLLFILRII